MMSPKFLRVLFVGSILSAILVAGAINAETPKWAQANVKAPKGGTMVRNLTGEPPNIHPIMYSDLYAQYLLEDYLCDALLTRDSNSFDWKSRLAEKWEISKDNKVYTFHIRKNAVFHDGKPVTAEDVKFSMDAVFIKEFQAADKIPYFDGIAKVEIVDPLTVKFYTKDTYFKNFETVASMYIIPKHIYSDIPKAKEMTRSIVCSGPYTLDKFDRGQRIVVKKFDKWYGNNEPAYVGENNFDTVTVRFIKEASVEMEALKKGDIDLAWPIRPEDYVKEEGPMFGKTVFKYQVENAYPKGYGFVGWNFTKDLFKDKNVRLALAYLFNRDEMIKKFRYNKSVPATGPTYVQSDYANPDVKPIPFDPKKAAELLAKSGWKDSDKDGVLDKMVDGKKVDFRFTLNHANKDSEKYHTLYKEDLKKSGIDMDIKYMEWNSFIKMLDEKNFDAVALAWSASVDWDPKQIWHSSAAVAGGSNFVSYKNKEVDDLIDKARMEVDRKKRIAALRKVYKMIADDAPYVWMFNNKYEFYMMSDKVQRPGDTMKYEIGNRFWWSAKLAK